MTPRGGRTPIAFITFLHIGFGELAPKSMAIQRPERTTLLIAWPLHLFHRLFKSTRWSGRASGGSGWSA